MKISQKKLNKLQSSVNDIIIETLRNNPYEYENDWWDAPPNAWTRDQTTEWDRLFELSMRIVNEIETL